jgi:hypothetical protein
LPPIDFLEKEDAAAHLDHTVVPAGTPPPAQVRFCYVGDLLWRRAQWGVVKDEADRLEQPAHETEKEVLRGEEDVAMRGGGGIAKRPEKSM